MKIINENEKYILFSSKNIARHMKDKLANVIQIMR